MASSSHNHEVYITSTGRPNTDIPTFVSHLFKIPSPSTPNNKCVRTQWERLEPLLFSRRPHSCHGVLAICLNFKNAFTGTTFSVIGVLIPISISKLYVYTEVLHMPHYIWDVGKTYYLIIYQYFDYVIDGGCSGIGSSYDRQNDPIFINSNTQHNRQHTDFVDRLQIAHRSNIYVSMASDVSASYWGNMIMSPTAIVNARIVR
jgi:hypothetical protein